MAGIRNFLTPRCFRQFHNIKVSSSQKYEIIWHFTRRNIKLKGYSGNAGSTVNQTTANQTAQQVIDPGANGAYFIDPYALALTQVSSLTSSRVISW